MLLSFRCFHLPLLAFLFILSPLNADKSLAADNAKEIKLEDIKKKVEALSFHSIASLMDKVLYRFPVVLQKNQSNLIKYYNDTVAPIEKDISIYHSTRNPSQEIIILEERCKSYSGIIKKMIKYSVMTDEDARIMNNGPEIDKKYDPSKFKLKPGETSDWSFDAPVLNKKDIEKDIINELRAGEKYNQATQKFANWTKIAEDMDEYSKKYQEGWIYKAWKMTGNVARKTPVVGNMVNAFGNTMDAGKKTRQTYYSLVDEGQGNMTDPNVGNSSMEAPLELVGSAKDAAVEAGRTIPGTISNPPLPKIPYPLP